MHQLMQNVSVPFLKPPRPRQAWYRSWRGVEIF